MKTVQIVIDLTLSGWKITQNRSFNYKICGLHLMKDNASCFDKLNDGCAKLNNPSKHFSVVRLCTDWVTWSSTLCKARKNETNFEVICVTSRSMTGTDYLFSSPAPSSCQTMECKQDDILLVGLSVLTDVHRLLTQWKFCEHGKPQKTFHLQLKFALT